MTYPLWAHLVCDCFIWRFLALSSEASDFLAGRAPMEVPGWASAVVSVSPISAMGFSWLGWGGVWFVFGFFFFIPSTARAFREWVHECCLAVSLQWCSRASLSPPICWSHHKAIWPLPLHQWQATIRLGFPKQDDLQTEWILPWFICSGEKSQEEDRGTCL